MLTTITEANTRGARQVQPAKGEWLLVHDGKQVIACHDDKSVTATGNPAHVMVRGSQKEIDEEIVRLKLATEGAADAVAEGGLGDDAGT